MYHKLRATPPRNHRTQMDWQLKGGKRDRKLTSFIPHTHREASRSPRVRRRPLRSTKQRNFTGRSIFPTFLAHLLPASHKPRNFFPFWRFSSLESAGRFGASLLGSRFASKHARHTTGRCFSPVSRSCLFWLSDKCLTSVNTGA